MVIAEEMQATMPGEHVDPRQEVLRAIYSICERQDSFTVDDIRATLEFRRVEIPNSSELLGALKQASQLGWCCQSTQMVPSKRPEANHRKIFVWMTSNRRTSGLELPAWDGTVPKRVHSHGHKPSKGLRVLQAVRKLCEYRDTFTPADVRKETGKSDADVVSALEKASELGWCRILGGQLWRAARVLPEWDGHSV